MSIRIALTHRSRYDFDRTVRLAPHEVRLRPLAGDALIDRYALEIQPPDHTTYWYYDALGNHVARVVFAEPARHLEVCVHLEATLEPINPFSFLLDLYAQHLPFDYPSALRRDLSPYLNATSCGPLAQEFIAALRADPATGNVTVPLLIELNRKIYAHIAYVTREEHGVQSPEESLALGSGSCRDSTWLFIHLARHLGLAARYVSGYQIQLGDGQERQKAELHAWAQVYLPGAGWIGFDPTLGLLSAENYIPLAVSSTVEGAAPIIGSTEPCVSTPSFSIHIERLSP